MKYLIALFPLVVFAGFSEIKDSDRYKYAEKKTKRTIKQTRRVTKKSKSNELDQIAKKLLEEDRKLAEILKRQERKVILRKKTEKILALTRLEGVVLNSILAMNVKPSKFIVRLTENHDDLEGGELRCLGYSFQKRVPSKCDLLVLDEKEYEVDIEIWDLDGASGIIADYFYSGEEKAFLTSSFASFLQGVLDTAKDRIATPFGDVQRNNGKNKVMGGLMGIAKNVQTKVNESGEKNLTISYVNSGKKVLVFFNRTLNLGEKE